MSGTREQRQQVVPRHTDDHSPKMSWTSRIVTFAGVFLLIHACYSAQEHAAISSTSKAQSLAQHHAGNTLPIDIRVETIVATLVVCLGIVTGSEKLHPIRWQVWAGKIERVGKTGFLDGNGQVDKDFRGSPFSMLEYRPGFLDIRRQRLSFAKWAEARGKH